MFKSLFGNNPDTNYLKVAEIAYEGRNYIESLYEPLTTEGQAELYLFNIVYGWLYLQDHSIVSIKSNTAERFIAIGSVVAEKIKSSIEVETYLELFLDRLENHRYELKLVKTTQFSDNEYFPIYFYRRLYQHPLQLQKMPPINKWDDEDYEAEMLIDIYKHQVNEIQNKLVKAFGKK